MRPVPLGPVQDAALLLPGDFLYLTDSTGDIHRAYDVHEAVSMLIRPDGHIGVITDTNADSPLTGYLKKMALLADE